MTTGRLRTARFLYRFLRTSAGASCETEFLFDVGGERRSATMYLPQLDGPAVPAWILLHGLTVAGRHHEALRRIARALAAAGQAAFVPEVPVWSALHVDPLEAGRTVRAALALLRGRPGFEPSRVGLMGFSAAATWALAAAATGLAEELRVLVGFGAYGSLRRTIRAMVTGKHEWRGRHYRYVPDPYGRWIVGADLLPLLEDERYGTACAREAAARALRRLARTSGRHGAAGHRPVYDPLIASLRETVPAGARRAFDLLAPPSQHPAADPEAGRALADALTDAGLRARPDLDPAGRLGSLTAPVILVHGRDDALVPFTETLRLAGYLPPAAVRQVTITRLIGHTKTGEAAPLRNPATLAREARSAVRTVRRLLGSL